MSDAVIAADDMSIFREMRQRERGDYYLLYGSEERCRLYTYFLKKEFGDGITVESIFEKDQLARHPPVFFAERFPRPLRLGALPGGIYAERPPIPIFLCFAACLDIFQARPLFNRLRYSFLRTCF